MKFLIKLFVLNVFLCYGVIGESFQETVSSYLLSDDFDTRSLEVKIENPIFEPTNITIMCLNYNSIKFFKAKTEMFAEFKPYRGIRIKFENCFNEETKYENYNNTVFDILNALPGYIVNSDHMSYIEIASNSLQTVNCDVLFNNVDFKNITTAALNNLNCLTNNFFNDFQCFSCNLINNGEIDLNKFTEHINSTHYIEIHLNKIFNIKQDNLKKFLSLTSFKISKFSLDDYNTFNVPSLFEYNTGLTDLYLYESHQKITLHEDVFKGLTNLEDLELENLQIDYIPPNLFKELKSLQRLSLKHNQITTLHSTAFANNRALTTVVLDYNPIFMGPQHEIQPFIIGANELQFTLENITIHSIEVIETLIKNPNVKNLRFKTSLIDPITLVKLFQNARETTIKIEIESLEVGIDFDYIKSNAIPIKSSDGMKQKFNGKISIPIQGHSCNECWMIKNFFYQYIVDRFDEVDHEDLGIFFETSGVVLIPIISCPNSDLFFEKIYEKNCPANCACKHHPLLKKIKIDCSNQNLTEIPVIPYPNQYNELESIDLIFENNSLTTLTYDNQEESIAKLSSSLLLRNNKIESMTIDENIVKMIEVLDLCENTLLKGTPVKLNFMNTELFEFIETDCKYGSVYPPDSQSYIKYDSTETKLEELYLNPLQCN